MNVLVTGGTGFIGSYLCDELAERGHNVTALSRSPEPSTVSSEVETVEGDVTDLDSIRDAFDGQDVVVNLVALSPLFQPQGTSHEEVHLGGTENVVAAAEERGVTRIVQMSALGADPTGETEYIRTKGQAENVVKNSTREWVIVRPSVVFGEGGEFVGFTKKLKGMFAPVVPLYPLPGGGETRFQPIWVEDLVPMLADCAEDDDREGEVYEIGGPEVLTLREITNMVYDAEGKSVSVVPLPMPMAKLGLTVLGSVPGFPMGPDQYRSLKFDNTVRENQVDRFGTTESELRTLGDYLGLE
jgi:uncharacterized protein YbjT (DUF2867 family)